MSDTVSRLNALLAGRYRVERALGSGGMGTVFLAQDLKHGRQVALKVLHPDLTEMVGARRFLEEMRVTATLQHPHILPLFDSGEVGGLLFYAMPFIAGESLRERILREGELPVPEAARVLRDVVDGLTAAHQRGVVHRDIKPENILLSGRHALIADFGIAKATSTTSVAPQRTTAGVALGTPDYMAPEQVTADPYVDHRADIYAVGAVAYELLTGQPPFGGRPTPQVLLAHLTELPRPLTELRPTVSPALARLVMRCLEKRPADRWQSTEAMLPDLDAAAAGLASDTPPYLPADTHPALPRSRWPRAPVAAAAFVVAALALWRLGPGLPRADSGPGVAADEPRLAVTPLLGVSGSADEARWGRRVADAIASAIDSTGAVGLVPMTALLEASPDASSTVAATAQRTSATHAMAGTVALASGRVQFTLEIVAVQGGAPHLLHSFEPAAGPVDSADAVIGAMARRAAAVAVLLFRGIALPLTAERIPASPEVIGHLERASELGCDLRRAEAARELRNALALDPGYVPALGTLAYTEVAMGNWREADSLAAILDGLSYRMLPGERLWWDYQSAINAGDWATAASAAEKGYRDSPSKWGHAAGYIALSTRRVSEAMDRLLAARPAEGCYLPQSGVFRLQSEAYHLLGRYDEELAAARRFLDRFPANALAWESEVRALAATGRTAAVDSLLDVLAALPPQAGFRTVWGPIRASLELRAHGHEEHAARVMQRALDTYAALPPDDAREERALTLFFAGRWADADTLFAALLEGAQDSASYLRYRGTALARLGRRQEALEISERFPDFEMRTGGRAMYYRAAIAASLGDAATATYLLGEAFRNGYGYDVRYHRDPWWDPVRDDPAFTALIRPR